MYTKKLLRSTWSIKEILMLMLIFVAITVVFGFIEFQDSRSDLDDLLKTKSEVSELIDGEPSVSAEELDKINVFTPVNIVAIVASFGFGLAFVSQLFSLSLQVNVTRKHLHKAIIVSECICSVLITATVLPAKMGVDLICSALCTGKYSPLADRFRDAAFNMSFTGKSDMGAAAWIVIMLLGTFALTVTGSLLMMLLARKKGSAIVISILCFLVIVGGITAALMIIGNRYVSFAVLSAALIVLVIIQYTRVRKLSMENMAAVKSV